MNALLTTIVLWLSVNFGLPANHDHPAIEFAPPARIAALRHGDLANLHSQMGTPGSPSPREVVAVYVHTTKTIYLPENWTGSTPAAYNAAVGSIESRVLVSARKLKELEAAGPEDVVAPLEPVDREPRRLAAPELVSSAAEDDDPVPGRAAAR